VRRSRRSAAKGARIAGALRVPIMARGEGRSGSVGDAIRRAQRPARSRHRLGFPSGAGTRPVGNDQLDDVWRERHGKTVSPRSGGEVGRRVLSSLCLTDGGG